MKNANPQKIALFIAFMVVIFVTTVYLITSYFYLGIKIQPLLIIDLSLFLFCYFLLRYILEKFIYEKIKVIYKTIYNQKVSDQEKRSRISGKFDPIEKAQQEVMVWEKESKKQIKDLQRLAAYRREFIGHIYHELKTPIFNIQGYVLTLLDGGIEDQSINKEYLERTEKNINRMIDIIEDLEAISKLESESTKLNIEKFDLFTLSHDVVDLLEVKAKKKKNRITFIANLDKPIFVEADKEKITQALTNLVENALKYGKKKHGQTSISFYDMDENILIEISDDGSGIKNRDLPRLFERFYRTSEARKMEKRGTGLGLSIVKHIIEAHKQTINVRSKVGVGSTFAFTLKKA